jgi:hypothetical protein
MKMKRIIKTRWKFLNFFLMNDRSYHFLNSLKKLIEQYFKNEDFFFIYSLSVFNLKIMTLYNNANRFDLFFLDTFFSLSARIDLIDQISSKSEWFIIFWSSYCELFTRFPRRFLHRRRSESTFLWRFRC